MKNYILKMFISDQTTNFVVSIRFSTFMPQKKIYNIDHMFCFLVLESLTVQSSTKLAVVLWVRGNKLSRPLSLLNCIPGQSTQFWPKQFHGWLGGSPDLVVVGGDSCSKSREFKSQPCILDGHFFTYIFVVKFVICVWKDENKWKRGRGRHI